LQTGVKGDKRGTPERKRWWEAIPVWTGLDFGAGPGSVCVREVKGKGKGILVAVGGGKKGGIVVCEIELGRKDITTASQKGVR
jgi:hypothetical protein